MPHKSHSMCFVPHTSSRLTYQYVYSISRLCYLIESLRSVGGCLGLTLFPTG